MPDTLWKPDCQRSGDLADHEARLKTLEAKATPTGTEMPLTVYERLKAIHARLSGHNDQIKEVVGLAQETDERVSRLEAAWERNSESHDRFGRRFDALELEINRRRRDDAPADNLETFKGRPHFVHSEDCLGWCDYACNPDGFEEAKEIARQPQPDDAPADVDVAEIIAVVDRKMATVVGPDQTWPTWLTATQLAALAQAAKMVEDARVAIDKIKDMNTTIERLTEDRDVANAKAEREMADVVEDKLTAQDYERAANAKARKAEAERDKWKGTHAALYKQYCDAYDYLKGVGVAVPLGSNHGTTLALAKIVVEGLTQERDAANARAEKAEAALQKWGRAWEAYVYCDYIMSTAAEEDMSAAYDAAKAAIAKEAGGAS